MKTLLLTLDYELYGNGDGDVFRHIIEPTEKILRIAEQYNARLSVFFEVVEYWKLKEEWEKGNHMGYETNPVAAMEQQLRSMYRQGHDIQLHIHPQWVSARWTKDGWWVDKSQWRLGDYDEAKGGLTLQELLSRGKSTIEGIIGDSEYRCTSLRAGGYNIQPSGGIVETMRAVGLKADTSIYPGGLESGALSRYDYTNVRNDLGRWYCNGQLETPSAQLTDVMELPIVAFPVLRLKKYLSIVRLKSLLQNRNSAKQSFEAKTSEAGKSGLAAKIKYFFGKESQTWDYCLFTKSLHRSFLRQIGKQGGRDVFTLVGHPKSFVSGDGFEYLLRQAMGKYEFRTITQYLNGLC